MSRKTLTSTLGLAVVLALCTTTHAQTLQQRINDYQQRQERRAVAAEAALDEAPISVRMRDIVKDAVIDDATARAAFAWWSRVTGISLVIDWQAMENDGIDPDRPISLNLRFVSAGQLLEILMQQTQNDFAELIYETTPWYVRVMTKAQANRRPVVRIYEVADLVTEIPTFTDAPQMDLREALSNTNSGGGGGASSQGLFEDEDDDRDQPRTTKQQRGEDLADLIRQSIEPTIWQANGGQYASVRYFNGRLIVNAPMYVQRRIGMPSVVRPKRVSPDYVAPEQPAAGQRARRGISGVSSDSGGISGRQ